MYGKWGTGTVQTQPRCHAAQRRTAPLPASPARAAVDAAAAAHLAGVLHSPRGGGSGRSAEGGRSDVQQLRELRTVAAGWSDVQLAHVCVRGLVTQLAALMRVGGCRTGGKVGLDGGCGNGRMGKWAQCWSRYAGEHAACKYRRTDASGFEAGIQSLQAWSKANTLEKRM
eukprot:361689-Chlamydomonas_euryale.AAC.6